MNHTEDETFRALIKRDPTTVISNYFDWLGNRYDIEWEDKLVEMGWTTADWSAFRATREYELTISAAYENRR